ncbi:MAG: hypothetical protein HLUCCA01_11875 [Bacteroidetes bacterium HLUCCA01]|nr:MAG: hypothetical protein HLUCCA01_11875 [Bacteroidetes bacterium HLUCCA01]
MKPNKPLKIDQLRSAYGSLEPDGWAVTRMKARLAREKYDPEDALFQQIFGVFRRYVLASMLVLLALSATLDRLPATDSASQEPSLADVEMWILGENPETIEPLTGEIPEYVFLMDY